MGRIIRERKIPRAAALLLCAFMLLAAVPALAEEEAFVVESGTLAAAAAAAPEGTTAFVISGTVETGGFVLYGGVTVTVPAGSSLRGKLYFAGGALNGSGDVSGVIRYVRIPAEVTKVAGATDEDVSKGWIREGQVLYVLLNNEPYFYRLTGGQTGTQLEGPLTNSITYVDANGARLSLDGFPSFYYVMDTDQTIPEGPDIDGVAFGRWSGSLGEGRTLRIPAGTNADLTLVWNPAAEEQDVPGGNGAPGGGGGGFPSGGSFSGGSFSGGGSRPSGGSGAGAGTGTDSSDSEDNVSGKAAGSGDSASKAEVSNVYSSGSSGNVRIRRASSNTRRTVTDDGGYAEAKLAAAGEKAEEPFPWEQAGIAAGAGAALLLVICLLSRRAKAKRKAMYEKLRIRDD